MVGVQPWILLFANLNPRLPQFNAMPGKYRYTSLFISDTHSNRVMFFYYKICLRLLQHRFSIIKKVCGFSSSDTVFTKRNSAWTFLVTIRSSVRRLSEGKTKSGDSRLRKFLPHPLCYTSVTYKTMHTCTLFVKLKKKLVFLIINSKFHHITSLFSGNSDLYEAHALFFLKKPLKTLHSLRQDRSWSVNCVHTFKLTRSKYSSRFRQPRHLKQGYAATRTVGLRVRMPLRHWIFIPCECCLCNAPIPHPEEPYRVCVCVYFPECDQGKV